jgi:hypothetical protein
MTEIKITLADLAALLRGSEQPPPPHPLVGRTVVARCHLSGVWLGVLQRHGGDHIVMSDAIRAWSWTAVAGYGAAGLAVAGLAAGKVEVSPLVHIGERPVEIHIASDAAIAAWRKVAS